MEYKALIYERHRDYLMRGWLKNLTSIGGVERCERNPSLKSIKNMADALKIDIRNSLLYRKYWHRRQNHNCLY